MKINPDWQVLFTLDDGWTVFARKISYPWIGFLALEPVRHHKRRRGYNGGFSVAENRLSQSGDLKRLGQHYPGVPKRLLHSFTQRYKDAGQRHAP